MKKKKLSILIYSLAGGGAERVVSILLDELQDKYDITLVLMSDVIEYDIPSNIKIFFIEKSNPNESGIKKLLKLPILAYRYKVFCIKNSIEISLAFMNRPSYISILSKIFGNKIKFIISERTTPSQMYNKKNITSYTSKFLIKLLYPKADKIISNSIGNRDDLVDNFYIHKNKIVVIYNPFNLEKITNLSSLDVPNNIDFNIFTFITIGRLDKGKNHKLLIDAFNNLENKITQLIILGYGSEYSFLKSYISKLNLDDRVFLLGFDNNPYKYLSKSDVFVFTSNYEGFPNVLVEALACSLPVISTDCLNGPREILSTLKYSIKYNEIEYSKYGILVAVNNQSTLSIAMDKILDNKQLRLKYKNLSKNRAKEFDKSKILQSFIKILG